MAKVNLTALEILTKVGEFTMIKSSIKARRERQKQATRDGILRAALEIARSEGWAAVTIRHVAELIEYSPPIIYEYFANKDALLRELQEQGFTLLVARMQKSSVEEKDVRDRVLQMSDAYLCFAYEQPELYQLIRGWNIADVPLDKTPSGAAQVSSLVQDCLENWSTAQKVVLPDPAAATGIAWGLLHGLVSMEMLGRISGGKERVRQLARQAIEDLLSAWAAK